MAIPVSLKERYSPKLIEDTRSWIGLTWRVLPRLETDFLPVVRHLLEAVDDLYRALGPTNGIDLLRAKLELLNIKAVEERIWRDNTPLFNRRFFTLNRPGDKEGYVAILLASIIARNNDNPPVTFNRKKYATEQLLETAINEYEKESITKWLKRAWQCRFDNTGPGTNTSLKWDETAKVIHEAVNEVLKDKQGINDDVMNDIRKSIHDKMRERKLWRNEATGVVEHDVDFEAVGCEDGTPVPFMYDNYTIMALVGLLATSEHKVESEEKV